jgi:3-deoxy-D-manno-octulosonic-acid transferase
MVYAFYNVATSLAAPFGAAWLALESKHRRLLGRFAPPVPVSHRRPFWVQACSVGEVGTAKQLIMAMRQRWPEIPVALTVSTVSGYDLAEAACQDVALTWFPFDHPYVVRRFVRGLAPRALILIETEIWPNVLREAHRAGAAAVLVNGRLSDKHIGRYQRFGSLFRRVLSYLSAAGMQNEEYAERLKSLGADPARVHVTGNTKFDGVMTEIDAARLVCLRREIGFIPGQPVVIFGSTRPGDETLAATCWRTLRNSFHSPRLVVAPRHPERVEEAISAFDEPVLRRSETSQGRSPAGERVIVLDTVGELATFYALATVVVIGGSFFPGVNGHNPIESAALGVPTVFGPYMRNFIDPARELLARGGAVQVDRPEGLLPVLTRLLTDEQERTRIGARGRKAVLANQGATERNLDLLAQVVRGL